MGKAEVKVVESMGSLDKYAEKKAEPVSSIKAENALEDKIDKMIELLSKNKAENGKQTVASIPPPPVKETLPEREKGIYSKGRSETVEPKRREPEEHSFFQRRERYTEPVDDSEPEGRLTPEDEEKVMNRFLKKNMSRRERKFVLGKETEGTKGRQNAVVYLAIIGLAFILFLYFYLKVEWMSVILIYVGLMMFLPIGMIIGWAFLDPYMRCKILRRATHKNFGIVNFVGKGQKIITKIKNFDDSLIWKGNAVWAITKEHIYQLSKDGDKLVTMGKIDAENIVTVVETVPVLFVDLDSMQPLGLARDRREGINPLELGPALKSWVDNEKAKALGLRKTMDMYFIIIIICSVVAVGMAYINMNNVNDITAQLASIQSKLNIILQNMTAPP